MELAVNDGRSIDGSPERIAKTRAVLQGGIDVKCLTQQSSDVGGQERPHVEKQSTRCHHQCQGQTPFQRTTSPHQKSETWTRQEVAWMTKTERRVMTMDWSPVPWNNGRKR